MARGEVPDFCFEQIGRMCKTLYANGINLDYMPHIFVLRGNQIFYVDFECNEYSEEWDFEHWGVFFWVNQSGMKEQLRTGDHRFLSIGGKPLMDEHIREKAEAVLSKIRQF